MFNNSPISYKMIKRIVKIMNHYYFVHVGNKDAFQDIAKLQLRNLCDRMLVDVKFEIVHKTGCILA